MGHTTTRLVLVYRNESFIPYFPGAHTPEEEEVKSKDISIIQWTEYFRTSKYWVQWGPRVWECLGSVFIRAIKALWKEICCVCVCMCMCTCVGTFYLHLYWIHWSTKYMANSCPTILIQLHHTESQKMKRQITDQTVT